MLERACQGRDAGRVRRAGHLANDALLAVGLEPVRCRLDPLGADVAADALLFGSGAVGICYDLVSTTRPLP
jgi:hypothetical protein